LHRGGFEPKPRGQVGHFLRSCRRRQAPTQLVETFRARGDGGPHIFGKRGIDADIAGVEIISRAGLFRTGKPQLLEQVAINRIGLGTACADNIEIAVAEAFERPSRYVEFKS
jgi:hypothetical protein